LDLFVSLIHKNIFMKKLFVVALLYTFFTSVNAQENRTKIEEAILTKNSLIKQEIFSVDNIPAFRIEAVKITNLEKFNISTGLRIVHRVQEGKVYKNTYNYIDQSEIDGLIVSLQYMKTMVKNKTLPSNYTEIKFATMSGFQITLAMVVNAQNNLDWNFATQTNTSNEKTLTILPIDNIEKLQKVLEQAKGKL